MASPDAEKPLHGRYPASAALLRTVIGTVPDTAVHRALALQPQGTHPLDAILTDPRQDADLYIEQLNRRLGLDPDAIHGWSERDLDPKIAAAALRTGVIRREDTGTIVAVPRAATLKSLVSVLKSRADLQDRVGLAAPQVFTTAVLSACGASLAGFIAHGPAAMEKGFSAAGLGRLRFAGLALIGLIVGSAVAAMAGYGWAQLPFALAFFALTLVRLWALVSLDPHDPEPAPVPTPDLPIYTILVPLYREAKAIPGLLHSLANLDYPTDRLDIKLLVEHGDLETRTALAMLPLPAQFERLDVPDGAPRTKPRALNLGLAAARGQFVVIYDAEDRPESGQLRMAAARFAAGGDDLACVQARLTIDNTRDNWITRAFTIEYAGLFDVFLPALTRKGRMIPLGGTSNHFRTEVLRTLHGWDAWNVTEDADLGVRLARFGYRISMVASRTYEEAPNTFIAWLKQRTRWLKGYVVTWCVHMREPVRLWRELGPWDFMMFHAVIGGVPLAALAQTVCLTVLGWQLITDTLFTGSSIAHTAIAGFQVMNLVLGYSVAAAIAWIGLGRQKMRSLTPSLWLLVPYWLLVALAGYRALVQLALTPFNWEKTPHGLARTSRLAGRATEDRRHS